MSNIQLQLKADLGVAVGNNEVRQVTKLDTGVEFKPDVGQISPKSDKSGTFYDQFQNIWFNFLRTVSVHFGSISQNVLKLILKILRFVPFGANLTLLIPLKLDIAASWIVSAGIDLSL